MNNSIPMFRLVVAALDIIEPFKRKAQAQRQIVITILGQKRFYFNELIRISFSVADDCSRACREIAPHSNHSYYLGPTGIQIFLFRRTASDP